jgi:four helix bundle protein
MRRASKSVMANLVEGHSHKDTPAKAKQYWRIVMDSANEVVEQLEIAAALGYVSHSVCRPCIEQYTIVAKQLNRLI